MCTLAPRRTSDFSAASPVTLRYTQSPSPNPAAAIGLPRLHAFQPRIPASFPAAAETNKSVNSTCDHALLQYRRERQMVVKVDSPNIDVGFWSTGVENPLRTHLNYRTFL